MFRPLLIAALLATSAVTAAQAQNSGGPPIAYIKVAGAGQEIYLSNETGTSITKLYTAPRKVGLGWMDLKPGGNQLAFTEGRGIKIQQFGDDGQKASEAVPVPSPCSTSQSPDYHPSGDGRLVFIAVCGFGSFHVMTYKLGDSEPQLLFTLSSANRIRWSRTGEYLYYDQALAYTDSTARLRRRNLATEAIQDFGPISDVNTFDVARTDDRLIYGAPLATKVFNFATMSDTSQSTAFCEGDDIHFSPTDSQILYEAPHSAKGTYILVKASNCSGSATQITGKGEWHKTDWRPDPVTPPAP